jgi:fumarate reductase flavoprotein subunit
MSFLTTALAPSRLLFEQGALLINKDGHRFCDELESPALALPISQASSATSLSTLDWPGCSQPGPTLFPRHQVSPMPMYPTTAVTAPMSTPKASSLAGLARNLGMNPQELQSAATVRNPPMNASGDGAFRTVPAPLNEPPFVALGPVRSVFVHREGGLGRHISPCARCTRHTHSRALRGRRNGSGWAAVEGHGHHLAWAFVSGRRAGRFAVTKPLRRRRTIVPKLLPWFMCSRLSMT